MTDSAGPAGPTSGKPSVRVRFAPSPSGDLHVGNIRTALFDWAFARHTGGVFVLRIEDTDQSRVTDEYIGSALGTLRWLGLDWDEGPEAGGEYGPYQQSQRLGIYADWAAKFLASGHAYYCYCTTEELTRRREAARAAGGPSGYDGHCRELTSEQVAAYQAEGRQPVLRMRMPDGTTTFTDLVRGEVSFDHAHVPDFVLQRADGSPLYTLAVAVDDVLMKITHVVRGEDLLSSTPRQLAVYRAMGVAEADFPAFAHLPYVLGQDGQKLGKRNGVASVNWYRESFTLAEMAAEFDLAKVNRNAAQFDLRKLEAMNGDKIRALDPADFVARIMPFLQRAGLVADPPAAAQAGLVTAAAPLIQTRISRLTEAPGLLAFLLVGEDEFTVDPEDAAKALPAESAAVLKAAAAALTRAEPWTHEAIEAALKHALLEEMGLKPRPAFAPVRVAVTGRRVAPPLYQSIELLGRDHAIRRLTNGIGLAIASG